MALVYSWTASRPSIVALDKRAELATLPSGMSRSVQSTASPEGTIVQ